MQKKKEKEKFLVSPTVNNFGVLRNENKNTYSIPSYQRSYAWGTHKVEGFWDELLISDNKSSYNLAFTGSVILKNNPKKDDALHFELIDGQQRFITTSILLAVMRDYLKLKLKEKYQNKTDERKDFLELIGDIQETLMIKKYKQEPIPRLKVGPIIADTYNKMIADDNFGYEKVAKTTLTSLSNDHERNIIRNYKKFWSRLDKYIADKLGLPGPDKNKLEDGLIYDLLVSLDDIEFIEILVTDDAVAYEIFETVNSKNEPLTSSDLIKNLILMNLNGEGKIKISLYEQKWNNAVENVDGIKGINFNSFLRYHWLSKYGWSTDKKLYANFKSHMNSLKGENKKVDFLKNFLDELSESSYYFKILFNPGHDGFIEKTFNSSDRSAQKLSKSLSSLKEFNVKQCYVLLLSLIRKAHSLQKIVKKQDGREKISISLYKIIRLIEVFTLKFSVLGKGQANLVERSIYHEIAIFTENTLIKENFSPEKIISHWCNKLRDKIENELKKVIENEDINVYENFERSIQRLNYNDDYDLIIYILEKINQEKFNQEEFSFNENFTLEHILPQQPKRWGLTEKDISQYVHRIGNLVVIGRTLNQNLGNHTLYNKLSGIKTSKNGEVISLLDSRCEHNVALFKKMKKLLPPSDPKNEWSKNYWNEESIKDREKTLSKEFYDSLVSYSQ